MLQVSLVRLVLGKLNYISINLSFFLCQINLKKILFSSQKSVSFFSSTKKKNVIVPVLFEESL